MSCTGVCKKWFGDRGFGFIAQEGVENDLGDIFVHFTGISQPGRKSLNIGEKVTFDLGSDTKTGKPRAENVSGDGTGQSSEELYPNKVNNRSGQPAFNQNQYGGANAYGGQQQPSFMPQFNQNSFPPQYQQQQNFGGQYPRAQAQQNTGSFDPYANFGGQGQGQGQQNYGGFN